MSTVRITWVDSVTVGVIGHKVYRDDVEIADVGMAIQTFDDTTAAPDTTYKYEVQAYTATHESTDETIGVNIQNITTAPEEVATEYYPQDNAASNNPEVNAQGSFNYNLGCSVQPVAVEVTAPHDGSYCVEISTISDGTGKYGGFQMTAETGVTYNISVWAKRGAGNTDARITGWFGVVTSPDISIVDQTWTEYTFQVTMSTGTTMTGNFRANSPAVIGDNLFVDLITITKA